jgi:uncharacterized protein (DUF1778 family)
MIDMSKPKPGRPATERGAYNPIPARQLGRVSDEDWETLKAAAAKRGESFTAWALGVLLRAAKRELGRK